jgi:hypothetical protein
MQAANCIQIWAKGKTIKKLTLPNTIETEGRGTLL